MHQIRLRRGVIDQIRTDRNFNSDAQIAAALGVTVDELDRMRHGAPISPQMALQVAVIQGSGFDLSQWVETVPAAQTSA